MKNVTTHVGIHGHKKDLLDAAADTRNRPVRPTPRRVASPTNLSDVTSESTQTCMLKKNRRGQSAVFLSVNASSLLILPAAARWIAS